ncbi:hypothetical protein TTHERM_00066850 (macronuclear) [Tetrahymena thermophila SB210]|uniref:Uncharacterized protein n=1 Tax=Tetrahymena thermophila (strain SB210) TaxID=312017 RepID=I7M0F5_TETTS|nr:hypothetical protein TTHERM_00066850 [Tetrahymena thermophila SB210]EAR87478.2 hypothetical protein TTHERM_00066850 [Tetrahymena thermophila SB210]|eukprot:XP_001007723.2 hypothetical protein TTHERM_00066850 [Tetrahymena thermophila SB210]
MNSILFTEEERQKGINVDQIHPLEYVHARNYQLQNIQQNIQVQRNIQQTNALDSVYLTNLFDQYRKKHLDIQERRKQQERFLNPNHFDTILLNENELTRTKKFQSGSVKEGTFGNTQYISQQDDQNDFKTSQFNVQDSQGEEELTEAELKKQETLRNQLYNEYIEGSELDQNQVIGSVFQRPVTKGEQVIYSVIEQKKEEDNDIKELLSLKKEWLKELNQEIEQINKQNKKLKQKADKSEVCRNTRLLSKLAPSLFTQYHVYFDEIFDALMDDILEEEVEYFNQVEEMEVQQLNEYEKNKNTYKLKEVIRNQSLSSNLFALMDNLEQYAEEFNDKYSDEV